MRQNAKLFQSGIEKGPRIGRIPSYRRSRQRRWTERRRESAAALLGTAAVLAVARALNPDVSGYGTHEQLLLLPCLFRLLTGLACPFCGMTTSFALMADGAVRAAWTAHVLGPPAYVATWTVLLAGLVGLTRDSRPLPQWLWSQLIGRILLLAVLAAWVANLARQLLLH